MELDAPLIRSVLENYDISTFTISEEVKSGVPGNNVVIESDMGKVVVRHLPDAPETIQKLMYVYDYLRSMDFPISAPITTEDGSYFCELGVDRFVLQRFLEGGLPVTESVEGTHQVTRRIGHTLGKLHKILLNLDLEEFSQIDTHYKDIDIISQLHSIELGDDFIFFNQTKTRLEDDFVIKQFSKWRNKSESIPEDQLSMGICHNNLSLDDFRFEDDKIIGVLGFEAVNYNYHLYDITSYMKNTGLDSPEIARKFLGSLIDSYLSTSTMQRGEFRHLHFFLRAGYLYQVFMYHNRLHSVYYQDRSGRRRDLMGYNDGISSLTALEKLDETFFWELIEK